MFKDRERSLEEEYFRKHDAKLIEKLRERGKIEEIVEVLASEEESILDAMTATLRAR